MTHRSTAQHAASACGAGGMCVDDRPGHAVTLMHLRLAHLDPDGWTDAVVAAAHADGTVDLRRWSDGVVRRVWHHVRRPDLLAAGSPVALHERLGVLSVGGDRLNVAVR